MRSVQCSISLLDSQRARRCTSFLIAAISSRSFSRALRQRGKRARSGQLTGPNQSRFGIGARGKIHSRTSGLACANGSRLTQTASGKSYSVVFRRRVPEPSTTDSCGRFSGGSGCGVLQLRGSLCSRRPRRNALNQPPDDVAHENETAGCPQERRSTPPELSGFLSFTSIAAASTAVHSLSVLPPNPHPLCHNAGRRSPTSSL